jgi:uncharacterized protein YcfJ
MKKLILTGLASLTLVSAQAQLFSPDSLNGAFWGALIGGIAGGDCHHGLSGEGAAIGAGVGLLAGALVGHARQYDYYNSPGCAYAPAPSVSFGYGYRDCGSSAYVYYAPNHYVAPNYYYPPTRPNYAVSGTVLGAASGALIGAGHHDAGKGAAIGAAAGLVAGSIAEHAARSSEGGAPRRLVYQQNHVTSKPSATSTYHWTPHPQQIADAPRVPDAPTF